MPPKRKNLQGGKGLHYQLGTKDDDSKSLSVNTLRGGKRYKGGMANYCTIFFKKISSFYLK